MKLELNHIAPYLPYNLQLAYIGSDGWWKEFTNCDTTKDDYNQLGYLYQLSAQYIWLLFPHEGDYFEYHYNDIKPLLTPLSELSTDQWTEVLESGLDDNTKKFFNSIYDCNITVFETGVKYDIRELISYNFINSQLNTTARKFNHLNFFNKLFELHADVYGLIEAGLAINKNTLKELVP